MRDLEEIVSLSHYFGTSDYVKGGGGNTSVKDARTLYIKPSGTTLSGLSEKSFIPMDRAKLDEAVTANLPEDVDEREEAVKNILAAAVKPGATGRPSVETSLHNVFSARLVVHTHPVWVNGMTCCRNGKDICNELFPESVWIEYTDPGYILFKKVYDRICEYREANGKEPDTVFLENHGVFIAAGDSQSIKNIYADVLGRLEAEFGKRGIVTALTEKPGNPSEETRKAIAEICGAEVAAGGDFKVTEGPLTPDHIVYAKSFAFEGEVTAEAVTAFENDKGYKPVIIVSGGTVYATGANMQRAELALELARDGALVAQLAEGLGGVKYMSDAARLFIENWEVEAYRSKALNQ